MCDKKFEIVSAPDKEFIMAFDKAMNEFGYNCGDVVNRRKDKRIIQYKKIGVKSSPFVAQIQISDGNISLHYQFKNRIDFNRKMEKLRDYIENAPEHIKNAFLFNNNPCKYCKENCNKYFYTLHGKLYEVCGAEFEFSQFNVEKLSDYMELLSKFYPPKKENKNV